MRTALYRLYAHDGSLLYVGVSYEPDRRLAEHAVSKAWFAEVADSEVEWFADRAEAESAERDAIHHESPRYNRIRAWYWAPFGTHARAGLVSLADALADLDRG